MILDQNNEKSGSNKDVVLITGASGGLANLLVPQLARKYSLIGVDPRPLSGGRKFPGQFYQTHYTQRKMAEVFRSHQFNSIIHLARIRASTLTSFDYRFNMNVMGTRNLLALGLKHGVKNFVIVSTFHVYGAHPHNHPFITEDEPLRASQIFHELADAVELDHTATNFLYTHSDIKTVVLRPVNVIGSRIKNSVSLLLKSAYCPRFLGYDPLMQFIDEKDFTRAITLALEKNQSGIYNISGEGVVPYSKAIELSGSIPVSVPSVFAYPVIGTLRRLGLSFPKHLMDYFRYPTIISDDKFKKDFDYEPEVTTLQSLKKLGPRPERF